MKVLIVLHDEVRTIEIDAVDAYRLKSVRLGNTVTNLHYIEFENYVGDKYDLTVYDVFEIKQYVYCSCDILEIHCKYELKD